MTPRARLLPKLGVGIVYFSGIEPLLDSAPECVDVLEIEPQTLWLEPAPGSNHLRVDDRALERIARLPWPKVLHGIGFPVGGTLPPEPRQLPPLHETISALDPPWISEHLSFNRVRAAGEFLRTGFLLPPRQTAEGVAAAARSIRSMAAHLPVPLAVETGVNYLRPRGHEWPDGAFVAAVVDAADCGILLDLHNLWTNQRNGRQSIEEFLSQVPLERVWEVHLAGGFEHHGYWVDSHSGAVPAPLLDVARDVVLRLPNLLAITFELFPEYLRSVGLDCVRRQLEEIREIWRGHRDDEAGHPRGRDATARAACAETTCLAGPTPEQWEDTLGALVIGREAGGQAADELSSDPGVDLIRDLLGEFRASMVAGALKLSLRLLLLTRGPNTAQDLLSEYWKESAPELFASSEAAGFARYLEGRNLDVPYLSDVLAFEQAVIFTLLDRNRRIVRFSSDPLVVLRALAAGRMPESPTRGAYEIEVTPDRLGPGTLDASYALGLDAAARSPSSEEE